MEEQVVTTAGEIDIAIRKGLGFPVHTGGPLKYADLLGLPEVMTRCERLSFSDSEAQSDLMSFADTLRRRNTFY